MKLFIIVSLLFAAQVSFGMNVSCNLVVTENEKTTNWLLTYNEEESSYSSRNGGVEIKLSTGEKIEPAFETGIVRFFVSTKPNQDGSSEGFNIFTDYYDSQEDWILVGVDTTIEDEIEEIHANFRLHGACTR